MNKLKLKENDKSRKNEKYKKEDRKINRTQCHN